MNIYYVSNQFLIQGQISDHIGRKRTILISLIGTATSYFALGLCGNIAMLSLARIPSGIETIG